jgi:cytochrome oxidase Cu insertion factor (SCO1/SenC/PrrC family)
LSDDRPRLSLRHFLVALAMCLVLGGLGGVLAGEVQKDPEARPRFIPPREEARDFRLRDEDGKWRTLEDAHGDVVVLTWLYSGCWDLCPAQAADIVQAVTKVGVDGVTVYGVSVDPIGDTPTRVRAWLDMRGLLEAPVHFLTGSRRELSRVWRAYGIVPINATSTNASSRADAVRASERFSWGLAVDRSAYRVPGARSSSACSSAVGASQAAVSAMIVGESLTASMGSSRRSTPSGVGTSRGSKARTTAPAATRCSATDVPAKPRPNSVTTT